MKPEIVLDIKSEVGECPLWHSLEKKLYWIDILRGIVYRYDPKAGIVEEAYRGDVIGGYTIQEDGSLLLFMEEGAIKLWKNNKLVTLIEEVPELKGTRFNDVIADPAGRVFCGTMPDKRGEAYLYRLDIDGTLTLIFNGVGLSNGMGFTPDKKKMYFTDSKKGEIYVFDYNVGDGSLSNQKLFLKVKEKGIEPDGLTVDAEGYVWSARWDGSCIKRFAPDGREDIKVFFPAKKITCMTFAGEDYQDMYVTSAIGDKMQEEGEKAGALFRLKLGIQGLPEHLSRIFF
ncbi:MAG: SMP-30/gluconolactonase/LRE family protein [Bacteroidetes bacterium]|nr:SMP-30/gluconolactonase/LRE family protein [Bacteroidota bacterium]